MTNNELPFDEHPIVCQYLNNTIILGIIQANAEKRKKDITPWICSKFINCSYLAKNTNARFSVQVFDGDATNDGKIKCVPFCIEREHVVIYNGERIFDFFEDLISSGYYITGIFNERYIPKMSAYGRYDFPHTYLLYGFDKTNKTFYSAGFLKNNQYEKYSIHYNDFYKSMCETTQNGIHVDALKYDESADYIVNYPRVIQVFEDYINSENNMRSGYPKEELFGLDALRALTRYYSEWMLNDSDRFDIRYTRGLADSKRVTALAIRYLFEYFDLPGIDYAKSAEQVSKYASLIHNLGMKYNLTGNKNGLSMVSEYFDEIIEIEKSYIPMVLKDLKSIESFPEGTYH